MIRFTEAINKIEDRIKKEEKTVAVPILDAVGEVIAENIISHIDVPSFRRSAMDGFAVNTNDFENFKSSLKLPIVDYVAAGDVPKKIYTKAGCVRVMTGAPVPDGYDAVIRQESVRWNEDYAVFYENARPGRDVVLPGEDFKKDTLLIRKGTKLKPAHIGILASIGLDNIHVVKPLKVTLISTGSELISPGESLKPGKIYNNAIYNMAALIQDQNIEITAMENVEDKTSQLKKSFLSASEISDIVITTGGVSVGDLDLIPETVKEAGGDFLFDGIAMKPGMPVKASVINETLFIHCSGNPFASYINFNLLFWPAVKKYYGNDMFPMNKTESIFIGDPIDKNSLDKFHRGYFTEDGFKILEKNRSTSIGNMASCTGILFQPAGNEITGGEKVTVYSIGS